jgi:protein gp37
MRSGVVASPVSYPNHAPRVTGIVESGRDRLLLPSNLAGAILRRIKNEHQETPMSDHSAIEWTDATWNPVRGCTKVSPGCAHCYAETFAERFRGVAGHPYEQGFDLRLVPAKLEEPLRWRAPRMVFVNSMSDLFQHDVPDDFIVEAVNVMRRANWHTFQVLTKRPARLAELLTTKLRVAAQCDHIWWGVSVEDRRHGLPRVDTLRQAPAAVRFLSVEPLLEDLGFIELQGIHWVIVGGESGPGARPMQQKWVVSLRDQCRAAAVPFFFKQWGGVRKSVNGRQLEGRTYDQFPKIAPGRRYSGPAGNDVSATRRPAEQRA